MLFDTPIITHYNPMKIVRVMYCLCIEKVYSDRKIFDCCNTKTKQKPCYFGSFLWHRQVFLYIRNIQFNNLTSIPHS